MQDVILVVDTLSWFVDLCFLQAKHWMTKPHKDIIPFLFNNWEGTGEKN